MTDLTNSEQLTGAERELAPDEASSLAKSGPDSTRESDRYLRLLAEFDNYRKRTERDRERLARSGKRSLIIKLIDLADGLDQALNHIEDAQGAAEEGLRVIHRQLLAALRSEGVLPFDSLGKHFNPDLHEAVSTDDAPGVESGTIIKEFQKGYKWGDEVLRHARVNVAR
ncbi:MAG TPA: nucleotide exchange factor GrpE [Blastocatellia bacterium]|nr:nucleotide exchange factor GrpE [Blastocatellia bacterium]